MLNRYSSVVFVSKDSYSFIIQHILWFKRQIQIRHYKHCKDCTDVAGVQVTRKSTWQCVTCLDIVGLQLHLNEARIVYCAHILSNTPHILQLPTHMCAAAPGMQLITTNRTDHRHCHISHKTVAKSMKIRLKAVSISLVFHVVSVLGDQIQQCCSSHLHNQVVGESPLVQTKRRSEEMEASLPRHP